MTIAPDALVSYLDHTLLLPDATESDIVKLCDEAKMYQFKSVCVERRWLSVVVPRLKSTAVLPITVVSFPNGSDPAEEKQRQTQEAISLGAKEIDMVLNRELLKNRQYDHLLTDIKIVVDAAKGHPVKVIIETSELTQTEKVAACVIAKLAGAAFVKTSTGFTKSGATVDDVKLMRDTVGNDLGVKASGGIRTLSDAIKMIEAGATRIGTSASIAIIKGAIRDMGSDTGSDAGAY